MIALKKVIININQVDIKDCLLHTKSQLMKRSRSPDTIKKGRSYFLSLTIKIEKKLYISPVDKRLA